MSYWTGLLLLLIILLMFLVIVWFYPLIPLTIVNMLFYLDFSPRTEIYSGTEAAEIFPAGPDLESIWEDIRNEGHNLYAAGHRDNYLDNYDIDLGEEDKSNWTTLPLRLFGRESTQYMEQCPITANFLHAHSEIKSCLFSIMEPGKVIKPHTGPYDGLIRYQLPLDIPTDGDCYLYVGCQEHTWQEGKGVLFDERNYHGAVNKTSRHRMVLLLDLERPYYIPPFRWLNAAIVTGMGLWPGTTAAIS